MKRISEQFRAVYTEALNPTRRFFGLVGVDSEAEHCHTVTIQRMTGSDQPFPFALLRQVFEETHVVSGQHIEDALVAGHLVEGPFVEV